MLQLHDVMAARGRPLEAGWAWWRSAWQRFMRQPGPWVLLGLLFMLVLLLASAVPRLGGLLVALLAPVLVAGALQAARRAEAGHPVAVQDLFVAFGTAALSPLLVLGGVGCVATLVLTAAAAALGVGAVFGVALGGLAGSAGGVLGGLAAGLLSVVVLASVGTVLGMMFWFAPALVFFRGVAPLAALKLSFAASLRNWLPFLLYSLVYVVAAFLASILFGLGWLVLVPVMLLTVYVSSAEVFDL